MRANFSHILFFAFIALFWGGSFLAIRVSVEAFPPFAAAAMRVSIATFIMLVLMVYRKGDRVPRKIRLSMLANGLFTLGFPWALLFWGEQYVAPAMAGIINATTPLFTVLIATLVVKHEKARWNKWIGVTLGFFGVLIIFVPKITAGAGSDLKGMLAILGMAVSYGVGIVWLKSLAHRIAPANAFFYQGVGALIFLIPLSLIMERNALMNVPWGHSMGWVSILYLGVFSTALAQLMFFVIIRDLGSVTASAITYIPPVIAVVLDRLVFGTFISTNAMIGAAVVLVGVRLVHMRIGKKKPLPAYSEEGVVAAEGVD
jgi:drug/metabolite transporter (DMT)-like permease